MTNLVDGGFLGLVSISSYEEAEWPGSALTNKPLAMALDLQNRPVLAVKTDGGYTLVTLEYDGGLSLGHFFAAGNEFGGNVNLRIDQTGVSHLLSGPYYFRGERDGGASFYDTNAFTNFGTFRTLAVTPDGTAHVVGTNMQAVTARSAPPQTFAWDGGSGTAIGAVTNAFRIRAVSTHPQFLDVVYQPDNSTTRLEWVHRSQGVWRVNRVINPNIGPLQAVAGREGRLAVLANPSGGGSSQIHAATDGGVWSTLGPLSGIASNSVAIDQAGNHFVGGSVPFMYKTAAIGRHNGTTFELATVGPVITEASNSYSSNVFVAIDSNNRPHLVYAEVNNSTSHAFRVNWAYWP